MKCLQIVAKRKKSFLSPHQRLLMHKKTDSKLKHCFKRNAVLDKGLEVRLVDNTYVVCQDGRMIIPKPKPLQSCAVLLYHHYL